MPEFYLGALQQISPLDALSNCKDQVVTLYGDRVILIILRIELAGCILYRNAFLEYNCFYLAIGILLNLCLLYTSDAADE